MNYKSLTSHPVFNANPFIDEAIQEIEEKTIKKRKWIKGNRGIIHHPEFDTFLDLKTLYTH